MGSGAGVRSLNFKGIWLVPRVRIFEFMRGATCAYTRCVKPGSCSDFVVLSLPLHVISITFFHSFPTLVKFAVLGRGVRKCMTPGVVLWSNVKLTFSALLTSGNLRCGKKGKFRLESLCYHTFTLQHLVSLNSSTLCHVYFLALLTYGPKSSFVTFSS